MNLGNVAAVFYCGFAPRRAARANLGLSLGQAYLVHWIGMAWLAFVVAFSCMIHGGIREVDFLLDGWADVDWEVIVGTAIVVAVVEVCHLLFGLMLVGPAAQDEPVRDTYRHAQRTAWIHTGQVACAILAAAMVLAWFWEWAQPYREMWYRHYYGSRFVEPGATLPAFDAARPPLSFSIWLAGHEESISFLFALAVILWVVWGWLRAALLPRTAPPVSHAKTCEHCGYNLNFIETHERCPECGVAMVAALGAHRRATAWVARAWPNPIVWARCAAQAWMRSETFFRALPASEGARPVLRFLGWSGVLGAVTALLGGVIPAVLLEGRPVRPSEVWEVMSICAPITALVLQVMSLLTAAVVGLLISRASLRNRCRGAVQVAGYLSGFLPVWAFISWASMWSGIIVLMRLELYRYQSITLLLWLGLNVLLLLLYVGGVARRVKYVQYANS